MKSFLFLLMFLLPLPVESQLVPADSQHVYQITLLRAAPGTMQDLIADATEYRESRNGEVVIMRHSQGDHWDIMLIQPAADVVQKRLHWDAAFQEEFLVESEMGWTAFAELAAGAGLYHIEMFNAAPGKLEDLLVEREMENTYLELTGRRGNAIFVTRFGSDVDALTIGFYPDMIAFATDPDLSDEEYHSAATRAGFKSRADIGFYLRQFITRHNDTLASAVR